jgi:hypothetical protein
MDDCSRAVGEMGDYDYGSDESQITRIDRGCTAICMSGPGTRIRSGVVNELHRLGYGLTTGAPPYQPSSLGFSTITCTVRL